MNNKIKNPIRYLGGEFGTHNKKFSKKKLNVALCFPDKYEIGMSNSAIKYLYTILNSPFDINCERVFVPDQDMEEFLIVNKLPLLSLESQTPIKDFDIIAISVGYELCFSNILTLLSTSMTSIFSSDRGDNDPVVILGGPAVTNPKPFSLFCDLVFIGEFEGLGETAIKSIDVSDMRNADSKREFIIDKLKKNRSFWYPGKKEKTYRSIWDNFSKSCFKMMFPVSSIKIAQDNGNVEIMRGCPNGCRFCHAGFFYRPQRIKNIISIYYEVFWLYNYYGYKEITLASLSSGDYPNIDKLVKSLNLIFRDDNLSFSLPSLKINSFSLDLLSHISKGKKSGLTFAVETPYDLGQIQLNKNIDINRILDILSLAKQKGWRSAKLYFMLGLPATLKDSNEPDEIIKFINTIYSVAKMKLSIGIGVFVPKPHTPFQWSGQLELEEARYRISKILEAFRNNRSIKISFHNPVQSLIEGIISRGTEESGRLIFDAWSRGARFDAWDEHLKEDVWLKLMFDKYKKYTYDILAEKDIDKTLPWSDINIGLTDNYLKKEYFTAISGNYTSVCDSTCEHKCGICNAKRIINKNNSINVMPRKFKYIYSYDITYILYIIFSKTGKSKFISNRNLILTFQKAFIRAGFKLKYSEGFSPHPVMEFSKPIPIGIESNSEILKLEISGTSWGIIPEMIAPDFLNKYLPEGISIKRVEVLPYFDGNKKPSSISASHIGNIFRVVIDKKDKNKFKSVITDSIFCDKVNYLDEENCLLTIIPEEKPFTIKNFYNLISESDINGQIIKEKSIFKSKDAVIDSEKFLDSLILPTTDSLYPNRS